MSENDTTETATATAKESETTETETKDLAGAVTALAAGARELHAASTKLEDKTAPDNADAEIAQGLGEEAEDVYLRVKALHDRLGLNPPR
jgi:hypothetical protein